MSATAAPTEDAAGTADATQRRAPLAGLLLAASTLVLDFFIVLACLAPLAADLGASKGELQLVLGAYAVANAALLPLAGRLGDAFGRMTVVRWSAGVFSVFALAGASSTSVAMLVLLRIGQGFAAGLLQPQVLAWVSTAYAPSERARIFGWYTACLGATGVLAQLVGGALVDGLPAEWSWRACIAFGAPMMLLAAWLARQFDVRQPPAKVELDWSGGLLGGACLASLILTLTLGREANWPRWSAWSGLGAVALAFLFVAWMRQRHRVSRPALVPATLAANPPFLRACAAIVAFYGSVASFYFLLTLELRIVHALSALQTAGVFAWLGSCFFAAAASGRLKVLLGRHWLAVGTLALCTGHLLMLAFASTLTGSSLSAALMLSCLAQGFGLGVLMGPMVAGALGHVPPSEAGVAAGLAASAQHVGNALGVSAIGFLFSPAPGRGQGLASAVAFLASCLLLMALLVRAANRSQGGARG